MSQATMQCRATTPRYRHFTRIFFPTAVLFNLCVGIGLTLIATEWLVSRSGALGQIMPIISWRIEYLQGESQLSLANYAASVLLVFTLAPAQAALLLIVYYREAVSSGLAKPLSSRGIRRLLLSSAFFILTSLMAFCFGPPYIGTYDSRFGFLFLWPIFPIICAAIIAILASVISSLIVAFFKVLILKGDT